MSNIYHVNKQTGRAGICRATKKGCPLGNDTPHFNTKDDAKKYIEESEAAENKYIFTTMSKVRIKSDTSNNNLVVFSINNRRAGFSPFNSSKIVRGRIDREKISENFYKYFGFDPNNINDYDRCLKNKNNHEFQHKRNRILRDFMLESRIEIDDAIRLYAKEHLDHNSDDDDIINDLKESFKEELKDYSDMNASYLNSLLIDQYNNVEIDDEEIEVMNDMVSNLAPLKYAKNKSPRILHRGLDAYITKRIIDGRSDINSDSDFVDKYFPLGGRIIFPTYMSTTVSESEAITHADKAGTKNGRILMQIMTPRGLNISSASYHPDEMEVLLDRNSSFMVVGRHVSYDNNVKNTRIFLVEVNEDNSIV